MQHKERRDLPVKGPPLPPRGDPKRNCSCNCNETAVAQLLRVETPGGGAAQEGVPTTPLARLDLGGDAAGERPPPSKSIHSGPRGAPKSGGVPHIDCLPFPLAKPVKANLYCPGRNLKKVLASANTVSMGLGRQSQTWTAASSQPAAPSPWGRGPPLLLHFQPASSPLPPARLLTPPGGLKRHQPSVRAGSNLHAAAATTTTAVLFTS